MATKLKNLRVNEISLVDRPANKSARVVLLKRDFSAAERRGAASRGTAMPDGSFPIETEEDLHNAVRLAGHSKHPSAARSHIKNRARAMGLTSAIPDEWGGSKSADDPDNDGDDDTNAAGDTDNDFFTPGGKKRKKPLTKAASCDTHGTTFMKDGKCTKCMDAYKALTDEVVAIENTLCGEDEYAKVAAIRQAVEKFSEDTGGGGTTQRNAEGSSMTTKTAEQIQKDLEAERDLFKALSVATDAEKEFMKSMKDDEKKSFLAKSADDRKAIMKKATDTDEVLKVAGQTIRKSEVGEGVFAILKAQHAQMGDMAASIAKAEEDRQVAVIEKRLTDAGVLADVHDNAVALRKMAIVDQASADKLEATLKAAAAQVKKADTVLTQSLGSSQALEGSPYSKLQQKAAEVQKANTKLTKEQAFSKVYSDPDNADIVAEYNSELRKQRSA